MKRMICSCALTVAVTSIALGQVTEAPQKHEMADSKKAEMSLWSATLRSPFD